MEPERSGGYGSLMRKGDAETGTESSGRPWVPGSYFTSNATDDLKKTQRWTFRAGLLYVVLIVCGIVVDCLWYCGPSQNPWNLTGLG